MIGVISLLLPGAIFAPVTNHTDPVSSHTMTWALNFHDPNIFTAQSHFPGFDFYLSEDGQLSVYYVKRDRLPDKFCVKKITVSEDSDKADSFYGECGGFTNLIDTSVHEALPLVSVDGQGDVHLFRFNEIAEFRKITPGSMAVDTVVLEEKIGTGVPKLLIDAESYILGLGKDIVLVSRGDGESERQGLRTVLASFPHSIYSLGQGPFKNSIYLTTTSPELTHVDLVVSDDGRKWNITNVLEKLWDDFSRVVNLDSGALKQVQVQFDSGFAVVCYASGVSNANKLYYAFYRIRGTDIESITSWSLSSYVVVPVVSRMSRNGSVFRAKGGVLVVLVPYTTATPLSAYDEDTPNVTMYVFNYSAHDHLHHGAPGAGLVAGRHVPTATPNQTEILVV